MGVRIGINGFGRIGRSVFRILSDRPDIQVVAVNDLYDNQQLAYLLRFDTVMGVFPKEVRADEEALYVGDERILMTAERDPEQQAAVEQRDQDHHGAQQAEVHHRLEARGRKHPKACGQRDRGREDRHGLGADHRHQRVSATVVAL